MLENAITRKRNQNLTIYVPKLFNLRMYVLIKKNDCSQ